MAKVTILQRGGVKYHESLRYWTERLLPELMSTRLANTLDLRIEVRKTVLSESNCGRVLWNPITNAKKKQYTIIIYREADLPKQIAALGHELMHVTQYAQHRLGHSAKGNERGRWWVQDGRRQFFPYATTDYWSSPWEIEARAFEAQTQKTFSAHFNEGPFHTTLEYERWCARR